MAITNLAHFVAIPAPQHLATMSLIQPTMCTHRVWCLSLIRTHINTLDWILHLWEYFGDFWRNDALKSPCHCEAVTSAGPDEATHIYSWISGPLTAGGVVLLNGALFIWIKLPAWPRESANAELWHRRLLAQAPGREQRQSAQDAIVPPRHFSYTNVFVSEPSFCTLIYTINVRVTQAQLLQAAYCRSTSPGALFTRARRAPATTSLTVNKWSERRKTGRLRGRCTSLVHHFKFTACSKMTFAH